MLISNSYYTYDVSHGKNKEDIHVGGSANISSSSDSDTIFEVELININRGLVKSGLKAYVNNEDRINSNTEQAINIYIDDENLNNNDAYVGFGFISIKEA